MIGVRGLAILIVITCLSTFGHGYTIPEPKLILLKPQGFQVTIPDEPGIVIYGFHGAINRPLKSVEDGDFSADIRQSSGGMWVYENTKESLQPGDTLYYWIYVQHKDREYRSLDKSITVTQNYPLSDRMNPVTRRPPETPTPTPSVRPESATPSPTTSTFLLPTSSQCRPSKTTVRGRSVCSGSLIFEDNFDSLNWTQWKREIRIPLDTLDAEFLSFQNRPENCHVVDGMLRIFPNLLREVPGYTEERIRNGFLNLGTECTRLIDTETECKRQGRGFRILPPVVSARVSTKEFFSFRFGKIEVRARLPRGDWLFPQIFLEPFNNEYGATDYSSGQMRVAFIRGNDYLVTREGTEIGGTRLSAGVVLATGEFLRDEYLHSFLKDEHFGSAFHTYSLTWTDESISVAVDDQNYGTIRGGFSQLAEIRDIPYARQWENGDYMAPFDREFFIALGVSVGGNSDFPNLSSTGAGREPKPWVNRDPRAELNFWKKRNKWHSSWRGADAGMDIDYVKVWAL